MRFVLIRHGQSVNNLHYEQSGNLLDGRHPDPPLTDLGHEQAAELGRALAEGALPWRLTALHCSLMARAIQTAHPVAEALGLPAQGHTELFECGGPYDVGADGETLVAHPGGSRAELAALSDRVVLPERAAQHGWWAGPFEGDEASYAARAGRVVAELRARHPADAVLGLVTHGWFTQYLVRELLGITAMNGWFEIHNTGITLIDDHGSSWSTGTTAVRINWLPHLSAAQITA